MKIYSKEERIALIRKYADCRNGGSGIFAFAKEIFPDRFTNEFTGVHDDMIQVLFQLLDPRKVISSERLGYFLVHREAGKSTFGSFLFPAYFIYMKGANIMFDKKIIHWTKEDDIDYPEYVLDEDTLSIKLNEPFIVIASETAEQATKFVGSLKSTIEDRADLKYIFGEKDPRVFDEEEIIDNTRKRSLKKWRVKSFMTKDGTIVEGIGANQRYRGANIDGYRPSIFILDDIYSEQNTKTEESRLGVDRWLYAAIKNSLDTLKGKVLWLGTLVHPDTVVKDFNDSSMWFGIKRPIIALEELNLALEHFTTNGKFHLPTNKEALLFEKNLTTLSWKERHSLYSILLKYNECKIKGTLQYFYQEYMNEPFAPDQVTINPDAFQNVDIEFFKRNNQQYVEFTYDNLLWTGICNLYIGVDPASSNIQSSDDTAIIVAGIARCYPEIRGRDDDYVYEVMPTGKIFPIIAHVEGGKYSITEYEKMPGMAETLLKLNNRFIISTINIEAQGQQEQIVRSIRKIFSDNQDDAIAIRKKVLDVPHKINTSIWSEYSTTKKEERIRSILLPIIHQHKHFLCTPKVDTGFLYRQLLLLGYTDHDDYIDALANAFKRFEIPNTVKQETQRKEIISSRIDRLKDVYGDDYWQYM